MNDPHTYTRVPGKIYEYDLKKENNYCDLCYFLIN